MRYFVHCDNNFRNFKFMKEKLSFLDVSQEDPELDPKNITTVLYGFTYLKLNNILNDLNVKIQRRNYNEINSCLTFADAVIIFHNFIEYNNGIASIIETCLHYDIPILIYTEKYKKSFLTNNEKSLVKKSKMIDLKRNENIVNIQNFDFIPYKFPKYPSIEKIKKLANLSYSEIQKEKKEKSIKLID